MRLSDDAPPVAGPADRVALGRALQGRAPEAAAAVVADWTPRYAPYDLPFAHLEQIVTVTSQMATDLIGRYLATGEGATPEEAHFLAERSTTAIVEHFAMADVVKNYLVWRDTTVRLVREESARLGVPRALTREACAVVRFSADVSMVRMVKEFDLQRRDLQRRLDDERAKLRHLALHDPLTGLANRTLLLDRLSHAVAGTARRPGAVGVLYLDLDDFKGVNDTHGHQVGDRLLVAVAARLTSLVRPSDTVARLGGDEFVLVCDDLVDGEQGLLAVSRRIEAAFAAPFDDAALPCVGVSVGGAVARLGERPEQVLARADSGMYAAKQDPRRARGRRHEAPGAPDVRPD